MRISRQALFISMLLPLLSYAAPAQMSNANFTGLNEYGYKKIEIKAEHNIRGYLSIMDCYLNKTKKDLVDVHYKTIINGSIKSETHVVVNCKIKSLSKTDQAGVITKYAEHNHHYMGSFQVPAQGSTNESLINYVCGTEIKKDEASFNQEEIMLLKKVK